MAHLEALQAIATLGLLSHNVQHRVNQLSTLGVMALRPIVTSPSLAEHEVVRAEKLAKRACTHAVHRARLQIHQNRTWHVSVTRSLIVIDVDALRLQVGV